MFTDEQKQIVYPQYAQLICEPSHWLMIAQYLYASAERLEPEITRLWNHMWDSMGLPLGERTDPGPFEPADYQRVYLMLIAYCLENLFKGYLVKTRKQEFHSQAMQTGELPPPLRTHNLQLLARQCPLHLEDDEVQRLHRFAGHATWIGRYPYPLRADQFYVFAEGSTIPGNGVAWSSDEIELTRAFVEKIAKQLEMPIRPEVSGTPT
jgi:hypothetical protein